MELEILQSDKQILKIAVSGKLDANDIGTHSWKLLEMIGDAKTSVILEFSGVNYISSIGIRMLLSARKDLNSKGMTLSIENLDPVVENIFRISGLMEFLDVKK
ncbi:MAG: STAS domain-containing protein [Bacteroidia bacterium]|nr:STAS domain-containing protein [Bacteroidia bacterium]